MAVREAPIRRYMCWVGESPRDGAFLVFARSGQKAKVLAYPHWLSMMDVDFFDLRVRWLRGEFHLDKLNPSGVEKVIEDPPACPHCELWGGELFEDHCTLCEAEFDD